MKKKSLLEKAENAFNKGIYAEAALLYSNLISRSPNEFLLYKKRGQCYLRLENFEAALLDCAKAVELDNKNIDALSDFGAALIRCQKIGDAREILEYALELDPNHFTSLINIGNVYQALNMSEKGLKIAMRAIEINPTAAIAYNNLGTALGDLNLDKESKEAFTTAINLDPTYTNSVINLCNIESKFGNHKETINLYESLLNNRKLSPNEIEMIKYYLSYSYLITGQLGKGWDYYEYGFNPIIPAGAKRSVRKFKQKKWDGESINLNKLFIWREQGLGDELEFGSCLADLDNHLQKTEIILECDARLVEIYKRLYPRFDIRFQIVDDDGYTLFNDFDYHIPIGSLPRIYRRQISDFKKRQIKFNIRADLINKYKDRLSYYKDKILVGICWRSGTLNVGRNLHYTNLNDWGLFLTKKELQFVNLQYGECENEIVDFENKFNVKVVRWNDLDLKNNLEELIALISCLDHVVTVATAVAPISGYVGTNTICLIREDWIMLGEKDFLPWSPNVKTLVSRLDESVATNITKVPALLNFKI
jgi:tetratricopeptide (TPR) repeat protein